jgi:H+/Cl- antiporter ClcA
VLVIALTLLVRSYDYNGTGMGVISSALGGYARPEAFALKLLFTAVTLGAGFKGGEIIPVFFSGATFGCVVGPLIGLPASFSAGLGLTALFCGVTNCPVTSVMLAFELFGGGGLPLFVLCSAVSYVLSGYGGLYYEQKIVFSKFKPEYYEEHYKGKIYVP